MDADANVTRWRSRVVIEESGPLKELATGLESAKKAAAGFGRLWSALGKAFRPLGEWLGWREKPETSSETEPQRKVLILGPGGTGKSTLGHFLAGSAENFPGLNPGYTESTNVEEYALEDDPDVGLIVPEGQVDRQLVTWDSLLGEISAGTIRGVILVTAFGYHSFKERLVDHELFDGSRDRFLEAYLERQRHEEVAVLKAPDTTPGSGKTNLVVVRYLQTGSLVSRISKAQRMVRRTRWISGSNRVDSWEAWKSILPRAC